MNKHWQLVILYALIDFLYISTYILKIVFCSKMNSTKEFNKIGLTSKGCIA